MTKFLKTALPAGLAVALSVMSAFTINGAKPPSGGSGKTAPIPAVIDMLPIPGPGLTNDGKGSYLDGQQNVSAFFFSGTRNAGLLTQANVNQAASRHLHLDLSNPVTPPGLTPFAGTSGAIVAQKNALGDLQLQPVGRQFVAA